VAARRRRPLGGCAVPLQEDSMGDPGPPRREPAHTEASVGTEVLIGLCFLATTAAVIGLGWVYAVGGQVQLEGALLFVALGGLSLGLGLWAKKFMPVGEFVEERPPWGSTEEERELFTADFDRGERLLTRRGTLLKLLGGALAAFGVVALFPLRSLGPRPGNGFRTTPWRRGKRLVDEHGAPIHRDDVATDSAITVFPEGAPEATRAQTQTMLIRVQPGVLDRDTAAHAPDGFVAYSKVCTHAGCPVALYQVETHQLLCPCHQSLFDVTDRARPVFGPATRALPQLPLYFDDAGYLRAGGDFPGPVGPGFWDLPS
jgi:ubiquinol-cytochrome c reductase iron-sulfur subunit